MAQALYKLGVMVDGAGAVSFPREREPLVQLLAIGLPGGPCLPPAEPHHGETGSRGRLCFGTSGREDFWMGRRYLTAAAPVARRAELRHGDDGKPFGCCGIYALLLDGKMYGRGDVFLEKVSRSASQRPPCAQGWAGYSTAGRPRTPTAVRSLESLRTGNQPSPLTGGALTSWARPSSSAAPSS